MAHKLDHVDVLLATSGSNSALEQMKNARSHRPWYWILHSGAGKHAHTVSYSIPRRKEIHLSGTYKP